MSTIEINNVGPLCYMGFKSKILNCGCDYRIDLIFTGKLQVTDGRFNITKNTLGRWDKVKQYTSISN